MRWLDSTAKWMEDNAAYTSPELLASLFRQTTQVGAVDGPSEEQKAASTRASASEFFDTIRGDLFKPKWASFRINVKALKGEPRDVTASIEETNRVLSLVEPLDQAGRTDAPVMNAITWFSTQEMIIMLLYHQGE